MDDRKAEVIRQVIEPQINRDSGNIIMVVGSSECGKSTLLAKVLLPIFKKSNGFITTFMSPNYDSIPMQELIIKTVEENKKSNPSMTKEEKAMYGNEKDYFEQRETKKKVRAGKVKGLKKKRRKIDDHEQNPAGSSVHSAMVVTPSHAGNQSGTHGLPNFKLDMLYKTKEWIFLKRGFDPAYCTKVYHLRLLLNKHYKESEKVREFRFVLALDDEIDIKGALIREVCLTWRNRNVSWIQLCQDISNFDCAVRNSAPLFFFGYSNFPQRREQIVRNYLAPFLIGSNVREKMDTFYNLTANKCFIFMNHRLRKAFHIDTQKGVVNELRELTVEADHIGGVASQSASTTPSNQMMVSSSNEPASHGPPGSTYQDITKKSKKKKKKGHRRRAYSSPAAAAAPHYIPTHLAH
jgi:energy-coupling factor transporter ATP-binding protein EcfA2